MPKNQANHVNQAEQDSLSSRRGTSGAADVCGEESLTAIAERLEQWRSVADEVLGVLIVERWIVPGRDRRPAAAGLVVRPHH